MGTAFHIAGAAGLMVAPWIVVAVLHYSPRRPSGQPVPRHMVVLATVMAVCGAVLLAVTLFGKQG